jgi:hypothetical protein
MANICSTSLNNFFIIHYKFAAETQPMAVSAANLFLYFPENVLFFKIDSLTTRFSFETYIVCLFFIYLERYKKMDGEIHASTAFGKVFDDR